MNDMSELPPCPACRQGNTYPDGGLLICPDCGHEWSASVPADVAIQDEDKLLVKDAHGNLLADGDSVVLVKDLRLKGSSTVIKGGTKIRGIRLVSGDHEVDCKVDGMSIMLKAQYLKKA
ncbi:MAG TPA: zinc ribbon domain-containing protein YjdM [Solimonas sp.]